MGNAKTEKFNEEAAALRKARDLDYAEYEKAGRVTGDVPRERYVKLAFPRIKKEIIDGYLSIDDMTSTVSDILDTIGINGAIPSSYIKPVIPGSKIAGTAVTIRNIPVRKTQTQGMIDHDSNVMFKDHAIGDPGDIQVYDFGGNLDVSCIGGIGSELCKDIGYAGAIIGGCCRDVNVIRRAGYPVFSCGTSPLAGKNRVECIEVNGPVSLCGKVVQAGDLIMADDSGVCIVPCELAELVLEKSIEKSRS